ncbi:Glutathione S-transferase [hydrothermal vent metagenome]|uniref:glutathione transferase n=1 Tax=hydrothermal vent metagenome TaxID=652676 RepID=A0A3B0RBN9_9ZZZZ
MITVHHLNKSRSKRVLWLLEELDMPYEVVVHDRDAATNLAPDSLRAVHPLGKSPIIVDGDTILCESGVIMEYILDQAGQTALRPDKDSPDYYRYLEWLHFAEGSLALPVIARMIMNMEQRAGDQPLDGYITKEIAVDFAYIEDTLSRHGYFAGQNFTAADIMMTIMLEVAASIGLLEGRAKTLAYLESMQGRAAYQKAASFG